jgi:endonuclease/exonuclease/phosphatase family metal-dependent hydrolase
VKLLIRTWNVFHGRTSPETQSVHLEEMVRLACADGPDVLCLQEVPPWALTLLEEWGGARAIGAVAMPPLGGPLARRLTELDPRRLRSGLAGQANAVLVSRRLAVAQATQLRLNPRSFRRRAAAALPRHVRIGWAANRRVAQFLRIAAPGGSAVVVNLHLTASRDSRPADAELLRAATYAEGFARPDEPIVLCGDLNLTRASSVALPELERWGFSAAGTGIDHVLVRGLELVRGPERWPSKRRGRRGVLLSDHAPVEAEMI